MKFYNLIIALSVIAVSCADAQSIQNEQSPQRKIYNFTTENGKAREIEIYFPKGHDANKNKVPGIIMFHGG